MPFASIAPTLPPLPAGALLRGLRGALAPTPASDLLAEELTAMFGSAAVIGYDTGRAAVADAMRMAARATGRPRVVIPAYTSYSVAAAATAAGIEPVLCDIDAGTFGYDAAALRACVDDRTAAVLLGNLFGWPEPVTPLGWVAECGAMLIDDAAQALGAREGTRLAGGRAPLGILSFGRGKCVTLGGGGALLVQDPALRALMPLAPPTASKGWRELVMAVAVTVSRSRAALGLMSRLPGVRLGESHFEPDFDRIAAPASVRAMATGIAGAAARIRVVRGNVAADWRAALADAPGWQLPPLTSGLEPAFLRYPVLAATPAMRERAVASLAEAGFGFVRSFPTTLAGIPEFAARLGVRPDVPGAEALSARVIALPCHADVHPADIERGAQVLRLTTAG
jgi:perosamine synthetase